MKHRIVTLVLLLLLSQYNSALARPAPLVSIPTHDAFFSLIAAHPADQYSKELFVQLGLPQSVGNTWRMFVYEDKFGYQLLRQGRDFRVEFDLSKAIEIPDTPWGYEKSWLDIRIKLGRLKDCCE